MHYLIRNKHAVLNLNTTFKKLLNNNKMIIISTDNRKIKYTIINLHIYLNLYI